MRRFLRRLIFADERQASKFEPHLRHNVDAKRGMARSALFERRSP
jgi:hypothetical protein